MLATLMLAGQAGAQVDGCNWTDWTFWDGAALPAVERCIAAGADIEARDENGRTPLHWAAGDGKPETVQALIAAGAEIEARSVNGWTPLHSAARFGTAEAVQALIAAGADIGARGEDGLFAADLAEGNRSVRNHDVFRTLNQAWFDRPAGAGSIRRPVGPAFCSVAMGVGHAARNPSSGDRLCGERHRRTVNNRHARLKAAGGSPRTIVPAPGAGSLSCPPRAASPAPWAAQRHDYQGEPRMEPRLASKRWRAVVIPAAGIGFAVGGRRLSSAPRPPEPPVGVKGERDLRKRDVLSEEKTPEADPGFQIRGAGTGPTASPLGPSRPTDGRAGRSGGALGPLEIPARRPAGACPG